DEAGIDGLAKRNGWAVQFFSAEELASIDPPSGGSEVVETAVGTPAVCEPAAILGANRRGGVATQRASELVAPKVRTDRVTVAIARATPAKTEGCLSVVGLGPGDQRELTEHARAT